MAWIYLAVAGVCEIIWALSMKYTDGFAKFIPSLFTICFMAISLYLLTLSIRHIPISIAYPVWTGIGAVGSVIGWALLMKENINIWQLFFIAMIMVGVIGVKLVHLNK